MGYYSVETYFNHKGKIAATGNISDWGFTTVIDIINDIQECCIDSIVKEFESQGLTPSVIIINDIINAGDPYEADIIIDSEPVVKIFGTYMS